MPPVTNAFIDSAPRLLDFCSFLFPDKRRNILPAITKLGATETLSSNIGLASYVLSPLRGAVIREKAALAPSEAGRHTTGLIMATTDTLAHLAVVDTEV
jgi:hypothetical protein